ncbi:MAG: PLP-dependent aminotransferase family protein [Comamonas sp.]|nr:PLP-dependent aminotransferase family protein [Comamonas sp.]
MTASWTLAARAAKMNSSAIREILKLTDRPGIISMAGGLPSPKTFPISAFDAASQAVLQRDGAAALQYSTTEGYLPLRQAVADMLPWDVDPEQVLIVGGSQQALDLVAKVFMDKGSRILVERPTYLGALQAFAPMEPIPVGVASDDEGMLVEDFAAQAGSGADKARLAYVLPNFQNPTGRTMSEERRQALVEKARELNIPLLEDNPYGDLRFEGDAPLPLAARNPEGVIYMGSFSKVLAPGLRLGFVVAPKAIYGKLVQAKQACDLHTPTFNQRLVAEVMQNNFLDGHIPTIRSLYKAQRDVMLAALEREMTGLDVSWTRPVGGMFLWVRLPQGMDAQQLLPLAVDRGMAFVPGAPFYPTDPEVNSLRLSYVTVSPAQIDQGIAALAEAIRAYPGQ